MAPPVATAWVRSRTFARALDVAVCAGFTAFAQVELRLDPVDGYTAGPVWLNSVLAAVLTLLLLGWRLAPGAVLIAMAVLEIGASTFVAHDSYFWTAGLPVGLVVYQAARQVPGALGRWSWLVASVAFSSDMLHVDAMRDAAGLVSVVLMFAASGAAGRLVARQERQRDRLDRALAQLADESARRSEIAAQVERNRIAVEIQDVVAHAVSEMIIQVGAARIGLETQGAPVPPQLEAAERTGRAALGELRRGLASPGELDGSLTPVPDLDALEPLLAGFGSAGLDLHLRREGDLASLPAGLQLSVYRVLQEALTNVVKHAGRGPVEVTLRRIGSPEVVQITVLSPAGTPSSTILPSGGHGLVGMRERVAVHQGSLWTGCDGDHWKVVATFPLETVAHGLTGAVHT